ncbi:ABC transporter ATP-binding protein [Pusillimonas sp. T2]|uniref:ABC transporter ATP-binding protein n=1 Tax=Pusillimonas sp. T2 TaxID=1548123 RepID=UPI000B9D4D7F|nr:ABC transporter ATP-binding protein [Pusillimonas sp. T2]OXR47985.1 ABC transporter ATP-binding protein [Pusillimonas sp. T2]
MSESSSILQLSRGFWAHLTARRKRQLAVLVILMVLTSFAEVLSLGAVLPFLAILTTPDRVFEYPAIQPILSWMEIQSAQELLLPITALFIVAALLAGVMRLALLYVNTKLSYAIGADFSYEVYRRTLYQPYIVHVSRNSSEVISGVVNKVAMIISGFLSPILTLVSSAWLLAAILLALLVMDPFMSLAALVGFGAIYGAVIVVTRKRLARDSRRISSKYPQVVKVLQEGLGGIRDVLIDGTQDAYCQSYRSADIPLRHAQASGVFIGGAPKFAAEALGMAFIATLAYVMAQQTGGVNKAITTLGMLALGAQRLLPILQQSYQAIVQIRTSKDSLSDALDLLSQPIDMEVYAGHAAGLSFRKSIRLDNLGFRYDSDTQMVLKGLSLEIPRGSRVGFIGTTGSGKSTLLDILMGLLPATEGSVWIDDTLLEGRTQRAWQRRIAHVPQVIYLADSSIAENIAFGINRDEIDMGRVRQAAHQAQISDYFESLPRQYETQVGERGVRLSGGQRQRIGIARALYKQAEVIVFDEATSALDNETERAVMDAIESLGKDLTILIIAHRLSTLQRCDQVVELAAGHIVRTGSYAEMIGDAINK